MALISYLRFDLRERRSSGGSRTRPQGALTCRFRARRTTSAVAVLSVSSGQVSCCQGTELPLLHEKSRTDSTIAGVQSRCASPWTVPAACRFGSWAVRDDARWRIAPDFHGAEVQIEARITVRELICLSERNQVIDRLYEQSQVIIPPRVCDLRRLEACKLSDRRRQFVFRWHRSPLHANRDNGDITPNSRLNFLRCPIFRQIQTSLPAWIFCR